MRYLTNPSYQKNELLKKIIIWFLVFLFLYWIIDGIILWLNYQFSPQLIAEELFGSPDYPVEPSWDILIESVHTKLFIFSIVYLAFISLTVLTHLSKKQKSIVISLYLIFGLLYVFSFLIAAGAGRSFAWLPLASWSVFRGFQLLIILIIFKSFHKKKKNISGKKELLKKSVLFFAALNVLFALVNFKLFTQKIGFTVFDVKNYYLGNEVEGIFSKSIHSVAETSGIHFVVVGLYLLAFTHFLSFHPSMKWNKWLSNGLFVTAFIDIISGMLVLYFPVWSMVKLFAFYSFEILLIISSVYMMKEHKQWGIRV